MLRLYQKIFKPTEARFQQMALQAQIFQEYRKYLVPFTHPESHVTRTIIKSYTYLTLSKFCFFSGPWLIKLGINRLVAPLPSPQMAAAVDPTMFETLINHPLMFFLGYGICYSGSVLFQSLRNIQINRISNQALQQISAKTFLHVLTLGPQFFFSSSQRKHLFNLSKAIGAIEFNLRTFTQFFIPLFLDIGISAGLILYHFGPSFVTSFLASFWAYSYFTIRYSDHRRKKVAEQREAERHADFMVSETWANYYNIKYYSSQRYQARRYIKALQKQRDIVLANTSSLGILNSMQRMIFGAGLTLNMILAAHYTRQGLMSAGDVILMQTLMLQLINPMFFLGGMYRTFTDNLIDIRELYKILKTRPSVLEKPDAKAVNTIQGKIQFRDVSFKYPNSNLQTARNLNLQIEPNTFAVFMGPSGVGKSTLFNLIFRLYDPNEGSILLDGQDLKDLTLYSFRKHIGFVSQQAYLFNDTVLNNLLYSFEDPHNLELLPERRQKIEELCKELGMHDYIQSLPQGYDTMVGEKGSRFSGGEKQRLCLIRALLPEKKILLLDEPTSALDHTTEAKVLSLIAAKKNTTRLMISHRIQPGCRQLVDRVIQLDWPVKKE